MKSNGEKIRVLLADDHRIFREALRTLLAEECEIVGEAESGEEAIEMAVQRRPQVVILDLGMAGIGGLAAAHRITRQTPAPKLVILSQYDDEEYVLEALNEAGAGAYVLKSDAAAELMAAVRAVNSGRRYLSPSVAPIVLGQLKRPPEDRLSRAPQLTRRESEVLRLVGEGATSKEIAAKLKISPKTAQVHRENLKQKLDLHTTAAMVRYALKRKLIRLD